MRRSRSARELTAYPRESGGRLVYLYVPMFLAGSIPCGCGVDIVRLE
jgi:hypothetical protein